MSEKLKQVIADITHAAKDLENAGSVAFKEGKEITEGAIGKAKEAAEAIKKGIDSIKNHIG